VTGDVVPPGQQSIAAAAAAAKVGKVISVHVIPRPAEPIADMLGPQSQGQGVGLGRGNGHGQKPIEQPREPDASSAQVTSAVAVQPEEAILAPAPALAEPSMPLQLTTSII